MDIMLGSMEAGRQADTVLEQQLRAYVLIYKHKAEKGGWRLEIV